MANPKDDSRLVGLGCTAWPDSTDFDPIADLEAMVAEYDASDAPTFLKGAMHTFRDELLGPNSANDLSN